MKCKTSKKKFKAKIQEMKEWIRTRMHCNVSETVKLLNIKLLGYYRYYGITDNTMEIRMFYQIILKMFFKTLNRRTQKNPYSFEEYMQKVGKYILKPRIYVNMIELKKV